MMKVRKPEPEEVGPPRRKKTKPYTIEWRRKPEVWARLFKSWRGTNDWSKHHRNYATEAQRDEALRVLNRKDGYWEYRKGNP